MLLISWKCCGEVKYNIVCIACMKIKKEPLDISGSLINGVELEGFEPSSKQGNHTLSTCLFRTSVFELRQDPDHQPQPYPLKFHHGGGAHHDYSRFSRTALPKSFGKRAFERCLVPSPGDGIKPVIYCTSIRQRERNLFRQINCWPSGLRSRQTALRMLTYHLYPLSNPVNPEMLHYIEIQCFTY